MRISDWSSDVCSSDLNQRSAPSGGNISLDHIGRRSAAFPDILPKSVGMDAASHVRGDADLPHLQQAVENLADVIGPGRNGNGLERSELAHAAGVVKELVEGVDRFGAKISDQGVGSLLAGTRASRTTGAIDGGDEIGR